MGTYFICTVLATTVNGDLFFLLHCPGRPLEVTVLVRFLRVWPCGHHKGKHSLTSGNGAGWRGLWKKIQVNWPVRQKDDGNLEQQKVERQERKWIGGRKLELLRFQGRRWTYCSRPRCVYDEEDRLVGLVGKASASRAEDPRFESRLRRDCSGVKSYQWLKNWQ